MTTPTLAKLRNMLSPCYDYIRLLSRNNEKITLLYAHMETEQGQSQEILSSASTSQEVQTRTERIEPQNEEHSWFYYAFGSFIGDATDELEKALARLQREEKNSRNMDLASMFYVKSALYKVGLELLMRRNPEAKQLADALGVIGKRKYDLQREWEKEILAREGEEGLKRRNQNGEGPGRQYTREELDLSVSYIQTQVEAGILPPSALKHAIEERETGGYYQWEKEFDRKNSENLIRKLAIVNDPEIATVTQNIFRLNEEEYGKDYAERQHAILTELAGIASQKAIPPESDSTAR